MIHTAEFDRDEKELLACALLDAFRSQLEQAAASVDVHVTPSAEYLSRIRRLTARRKNHRRRVLAAAVAAVIILLSSCAAVIIHREEIADFVADFFSDRIQIFSDDKIEYPDTMEYCGLSYLPEGYELEQSSFYYGNVSYYWTSGSGEHISFAQHFLSGAYGLDYEGAAPVLISHGDIEIYYQEANENYHAYMWRDGVYMMSLGSSTRFAEEELKKIIDGIETVGFIDKNSPDVTY